MVARLAPERENNRFPAVYCVHTELLKFAASVPSFAERFTRNKKKSECYGNVGTLKKRKNRFLTAPANGVCVNKYIYISVTVYVRRKKTVFREKKRKKRFTFSPRKRTRARDRRRVLPDGALSCVLPRADGGRDDDGGANVRYSLSPPRVFVLVFFFLFSFPSTPGCLVLFRFYFIFLLSLYYYFALWVVSSPPPPPFAFSLIKSRTAVRSDT